MLSTSESRIAGRTLAKALAKAPASIPATLIRRYKRFLADVTLADGQLITVHCPNTGSMKYCVEEGARVWLSKSSNPKRKYAYTWEIIQTGRGDYIGINSARANDIVEDGISRDIIPQLAGYQTLGREIRYGHEGSRIDFLLMGHKGQPDCYVEVKSVTLLERPSSKGVGLFPDSVSDRGARHLRELMSVRKSGFRAVLLFCIQHSGIRSLSPADQIDPKYGQLLREADAQGVEILAYKARYDRGRFRAWRQVPVLL